MKPNRILCGVDFSEHSVNAIRMAVEIAQVFKAELHVIHVIETSLTVPDDARALENSALRAIDALAAEWRNSLNDSQVTTEVTTGLASTEIVKYANNEEVDLVVLGNKGVTLFEETVIGTTVERVLKEARCSVLVIKQRSRR